MKNSLFLNIIVFMNFIKGFIRKHKLFTIQVAVVLSLIIALIVLSILKTNQEVCEAWTRGTTRFHETLFGKLTEWIPFSLTERSTRLALLSPYGTLYRYLLPPALRKV